jgi:hypothetical protein
MNNQVTQNQINKNKVQDNTLMLKNTDDLIKQILELKNINSNVDEEDIIELLTIASCLKYLEYKEKNDFSNFNLISSLYLNHTKH